MTQERIREFKGKYYFLSNFYPSRITIKGKEFPTVEHYYQASKTLDENEFETIRKKHTPGQAKYFGRRCKLREDWESIKIEVMKEALITKFSQHPALKKKLIETGELILEEGNSWNDVFWGKDLKNDQGKNMLGILLMELRSQYRNDFK